MANSALQVAVKLTMQAQGFIQSARESIQKALELRGSIKELAGSFTSSATASAGISSQMNAASGASSQLSDVMEKQSQIFDNGSASAGAASMSFGDLKGVIIGLTTAYLSFQAAQSFATDLVQTVAAAQQLQGRLQALTSTTSEYNETQAYLEQTADELSVGIETLSNSYAQLLVLKDSKLINTDELRSMLEGLSNFGQQAGASQQQIEQAMYGLSQALGSGTVRAEELNQVTEALPGSLSALGEAAGTTAGGFRAMVNDGKVSSEMFKELFIKSLSKYEGAAAATANNIIPTYTRMMNAFYALKISLAEPVSIIVIPLLNEATQYIKQLTDYTRNNRDEVVAWSEKVGAFIRHMLQQIIPFFAIMGKFIAVLLEFAASMEAVFSAVILYLQWINVGLIAGLAAEFPQLTVIVLGLIVSLRIAMSVLQAMALMKMTFLILQFVAMPPAVSGITLALRAATAQLLAFVGLNTLLSYLRAQVIALLMDFAKMAAVTAVVYTAIQAYNAWQAMTDEVNERHKEVASSLEKVKSESEKLNAKNINVKNIEGLKNDQLLELKDSLIQRISQYDSVKMQLEAMQDFGFKVDPAQYQESVAGLALYKQELEKVKAKIKEVAATTIKVDPKTQPLKDGVKDVEAFYASLQAIGDGQITQALNSVQTAADETVKSLELKGYSAANSQLIVQVLQQASNQIVALESSRAQQQIELTERVALAKAEDIRKTTQGAEQQATALRALANEVADARVASTQKAYEATRSQLEKAKQEYQKYAEVAKSLEKSIAGELARQADVVQELTRKNMSAAEQYASRKQELATLSGNFESAIAEGNYQKAEEIARKQESLAQQVAEAAKNAGVDEPQANTESLDLVKQAHERINQAMSAQKQVADDNAQSQLAHVKNLTTSMDTLAQTLQGLQDKQIDLKLNVNQAGLDQEFAAIETRLKERDFTVALKFAQEKGIPEGGLDVAKTVQEAKVDPKVVLFNPDITKVNEAIEELKKPSESVHTVVQKTEQQVAVTVDENGLIAFNDAAQAKITPKTLIINPLSTDVDNKIAELKKPTESTHTIHVKQDGSTPSGYAGGGLIQGPGTETSDSILARLSRNEYVIPAYATHHYGSGFFDQLRRLQIPKFANGGLVGGANVNTSTTQNSISTIVNNLAAQTAQSMTPVTINVTGKPIKFDTDNAGAVEQLVRELTGRTRGG